MGRTAIAWGLAAVALGWGAVILAAPAAGVPGLSAVTYVVGAFLCHQRPDRSFQLAGAQLPVCARCAALYWAGAIGVIGWLLARGQLQMMATQKEGAPYGMTLATRAILLAAVPVIVSVATASVGVWDPGNAVRALLSAPLGLVVGVVLAAVVRGDLR